MRLKDLKSDRIMDHTERDEFHKWAVGIFAEEALEVSIDARLRATGRTDRERTQARRSRFNLEKHRRVGSSQMRELLS